MIGVGSRRVMVRITTSRKSRMKEPPRARYSWMYSLPMKGTVGMMVLKTAL
jgi:hypothetical protein